MRVGERRLGLVVVGQFLGRPVDEELLNLVRRAALDCGLDTARLVELAGGARVLPPDRVELVPKLLLTIASALSEIASQNYHVRSKLAQIAQIVGTG